MRTNCKLPAQGSYWGSVKAGGRYKVVGYLAGSGKLKGETIIYYVDIKEGPSYGRLLSEWHERMSPLS